MDLTSYAHNELRLSGFLDSETAYNEKVGQSVMELIQAFVDQGHSEYYKSLVVDILEKLLRYQPLSPLTGADDEWEDMSSCGDPRWQNKRYPHVFKDSLGRAFNTHGRVFVEENGGTYTAFESSVPVVFPYIPKTEYVKVPYPKKYLDNPAKTK